MNRRGLSEPFVRPPPAWVDGAWRVWLHPVLPHGAASVLVNVVREGSGVPEAEILHAGRNTVWRRAGSDLPSGDVVIKAYPAPSPLRRRIDARRGSKALRAYVNGRYLERHGIATPRALACLEHHVAGRCQGAWLVTAHVEDAVSFKRVLIRHFRHDPDCERLMSLLKIVARAVYRLHETGFQHRDLGNQNIFLSGTSAGSPETHADGVAASETMARVWFMDLNRGRRHARLTLAQRARDLSRLYLPSDLLRVFLVMYWQDRPVPPALRNAERRHRRRYALHTRTRPLRHPFRTRRGRGAAQGADTYPAEPDLWIWDRRSAQAIPALDACSRRRHVPVFSRLYRPLRALIRFGPAVWRHYRRLSRNAFPSGCRVTDGVFVAVDGAAAMLDTEIHWLRELGVGNVLLRFYHHDPPLRRTEALAAFDRLVDAGFRVAVALVQDRAAVRAPRQWEAFCRGVLCHLDGRAAWVEYGHAVNRVKWGIWSFREYDRLARLAAGLKTDFPGLILAGPATIDFEYDYAAAALDGLPRNFQWDAFSLHLYVDRRGAPENRQGRFDAVAKFALARALAMGSGKSAPRVMVSEFNWPLSGTGVWSPVGSPYVTPGPRRNDPGVDEGQQAQYLVRYLLLALCSGLVEACVFWRLAAHGFGLIDDRAPGGWRTRPAFHALQHLLRRLDGAWFERALSDGRRSGLYALQFRRADGAPLVAAWSHPDPLALDGPFPVSAAWDLLGQPIEYRPGDPLGPAPVYLMGAAATTPPPTT